MTDPISYGPVDEAVKQWLLTTPAGVEAGGKVFMAMPKSPPPQALLVLLVGGGPTLRGDLPIARYRMQFDCIGPTRQKASAIMRALMADLDELGRSSPGFVAAGVYIGGADVIGVRWLPDPDSDLPRYIVDALITTVR